MSAVKAKIALGVLLLSTFFYNAGKFLGYPPMVFPDENTFITSTVKQPIAESVIPNYLYYGVYTIVRYFETGWLDAARVLNGFFYTLAGVFLYGIARMACGPGLSLLVTATSLLLPYSWYTTFFMPEGLYFTCFWIWAWFVLRYRRSAALPYGLLAGAGLGLASLVKVHAIFLAPGFILFVLLTSSRGWRAPAAWLASLVVIPSMLATKLLFGFLLAGGKGVTLLGHDYGELTQSGVASYPMSAFIGSILYNLPGHLLLLLFYFGLIVAVAFVYIARVRPEEGEKLLAARNLSVLVIALLVVLIGVTVAFTANMHLFLKGNDFEEIELIQTRYYSFLYPGFVILGGYFLACRNAVPLPPFLRWVFAALILLSALDLLSNFLGYAFFAAHSPEVKVPFRHWPSWTAIGVTMLTALPCCLALRNPGKGLWTFSCIVMPLLAAYYAIVMPLSYSGLMVQYDPLIASGWYLGNTLRDEVGQMTVIDTGEHKGSKILFFAGAKNVRYLRRIMPGREIGADRLTPGSKWVLLVGNVSIPAHLHKFSLRPAPREYQYLLVRIADFSFSADFGSPSSSWPIVEMRKNDGIASIDYAIPLPRVMRVRFDPPEGMGDGGFVLEAEGLPKGVPLDAEAAKNGKTVTIQNPGRTLRLRAVPGGDGAVPPLPEKIEITVRSELPEYAAWEHHPVALPIDYVPTPVSEMWIGPEAAR